MGKVKVFKKDEFTLKQKSFQILEALLFDKI